MLTHVKSAPCLLLLAALAACGPAEPVRIGFVGGLSDRNSDVGQSGHEGAVLAVEQWNRAGGIRGRPIELVARDDAQRRDSAERAADELAAAKVEAVIGPFTSGMAVVVAPRLAKDGILVVSPTTTSMDLVGKDDNLVRLNGSTRDYARAYAKALRQRGLRHVAAAWDTRNRAYSESWLGEFRAAMVAEGGEVTAHVPFESDPGTDFGAIVGDLLLARPDGLFFIAGALDVARLAQHARKRAPGLAIGAAEWASTGHLLELGGKMVEGLFIVQQFDPSDTSPAFVAFREAYFNRFQHLPGYAAVAAYDAAQALFTALAKRKSGETAKQALLANGPYAGLQQSIAFDATGDTQRRMFFSEVREGRYFLVDGPKRP